MIDRLIVQHYRSIESIDLQLGAVNLFVGRNGSGKSNILDAIRFTRDALKFGLDQAITDRHGLSSIRQWAPTRPYDITVTIEVSIDTADAVCKGFFSFTLATLSSSGEAYSIKKEEGGWVGTYYINRRPGDIKSIDVNYSYSRKADGSVLIVLDGEARKQEIDDLQEFFLGSRQAAPFGLLRAALVDFDTYVIFPNTLRLPQRQSNEAHLLSHGENLASVLKRMRAKKKADAIGEIIACMKHVIPGLDNITVQSVGGYVVPQFKVASDTKSHTFNVDQMSDGTLRMLGLLVALYQDPVPRTIALEEPELTIHPGALRLISDSISEISERTQVLVTTHSPDLLDAFAPEQITAIDMVDGVTRARPLAAEQARAVRDDLFTLGQLLSMEGLHG